MLALLVVVGIALFLIWTRMTTLEGRVNELLDRVRTLERQGQPVAPRPIAEPRPVAQPPAPVSTAAPAPPIQSEPPLPIVTTPAPQRPPSSPAAEPAAVHAVTPPPTGISLESRIGGRWLLYLGVITIVIGAAYFEKLAIDNHWISETARTIEGGIFGLALVAGGLQFARRGYRLYGQMVTGGGVAVLYVAAYAAFNYYHLISRPAALTVMLLITALASWLADRERSQGLGVMAVGGGFATPFLLASHNDAQIALFTYEAILIAGTMYLAHRRAWPALNIVSYAFTVVTVAAWASEYYTASKYAATELYLTLFCAMFCYLLREARHRTRSNELELFVLSTAPVLYYLASLAVLASHSIALLVYLIALGLAGAVIGLRFGSVPRLAAWIATAAPLMVWAAAHAGRTWLFAGLAATMAVYVSHLLAHFESTTRQRHQITPVDTGLLHLNGLWAYGTSYLLVEPVSLPAAAAIAALFAAWNGMLALVVTKRDREHGLHFAALGFTLLTVAIALEFDGPWITVGWAAEGAVVLALGLRARREWFRLAGVLLFAVAIARLLALQFAEPPIDQTALLNRRAACGVFVIVLTYWVARLLRRDAQRPRRALETAAAVVAAQVLTLTLFTSEIIAYWSIHDAAGNSLLARGLMLSVTWALYATILIIAGIWKRYAPIRYLAIVLFAVTIAKVFAVDLAELDRIYRISSIVGLGIALLVSSWLYQRFEKEFNQ